MKIAVIGYSGNVDETPVKQLGEICEELGHKIAIKKHILINGGTDGIMALVSRSARNASGEVIGIVAGLESGNKHLSFEFKTGMDSSMRSVLMMYNVDAIISVGGKAGTGLELFSAYLMGIPIVLLRGTGGWTDRIAGVLIEGKYLDERKLVEIKNSWNVDDAIELAENSKRR
ncbi:MAG: TIGR00725 family protein [Thermotogae bacterium]|jgi:uncharacterized protein (TIGR00725 family)|nr:TIGR00725 family protein [Thermotogota bacterium]